MHIMRTVLLVIALGMPGATTALAQTKEQPKKSQFLFVQTAQNVAFNNGVLTLHGVSPVTAFFSDRPERIVGHVRNDLFLKQWSEGKNSFKQDPPNAVLSIFNQGTRPTGAVVVLSNPRVAGSDLIYDARALNGGNLPATAAESTLFIDGGGAPCDPQFDTGDPGYPCWAQQAFADR